MVDGGTSGTHSVLRRDRHTPRVEQTHDIVLAKGGRHKYGRLLELVPRGGQDVDTLLAEEAQHVAMAPLSRGVHGRVALLRMGIC